MKSVAKILLTSTNDVWRAVGTEGVGVLVITSPFRDNGQLGVV